MAETSSWASHSENFQNQENVGGEHPFVSRYSKNEKILSSEEVNRAKRCKKRASLAGTLGKAFCGVW